MKEILVAWFFAMISLGLANQCPQDQGDWKELILKHEDCGKFYKCTSEGPVTMYCPDGLYFNPEISMCDWKQNVNCSEETSSEDEEKETVEECEMDSKETDNSEMEDFEGENKSNESESSEIKLLENGCPIDHNIHWLLPDENDCNIFYYCVGGEKIRRTCPSHLHFNHKLQVCDWPEVAGCSISSENSASEENASKEKNSEEGDSKEDNSEVDTSEIDTSEEETKEIDTSEEETKEIDTSEEETKEIDTSEEETKEIDTSEEETKEIDTSEEDISESDTSEVDTSETDTTEDTSEGDSQIDSELIKKIEAAVNVKLLNLLQ